MLEFNIYFEQVLQQIEKKGVGVLATTYNALPKTRMVSFVTYEDSIAFQTSSKLEKYAQISQNDNIALCFSNINIQGKARIEEGKAINNKKFIELYKVKHHSSYKAYSKMDSNKVIKVIFEKIVLWIYEDGEPYRVFLDVVKKELKKEKYNHSNND